GLTPTTREVSRVPPRETVRNRSCSGDAALVHGISASSRRASLAFKPDETVAVAAATAPRFRTTRLSSPIADRHHRDDGGDAEHDAEDAQRGTQLVAAESFRRDGEEFRRTGLSEG